MNVCKFFLQGRCKFGDRCRNHHPKGGIQEHHQNQRGYQHQLSSPVHRGQGGRNRFELYSSRADSGDDYDNSYRQGQGRGRNYQQRGGYDKRQGNDPYHYTNPDYRQSQNREHWRDGEGRSHWRDGEERSHWRGGEGSSHWRGGEGRSHWRGGEGRSHWRGEESKRGGGMDHFGSRAQNFHSTRHESFREERELEYKAMDPDGTVMQIKRDMEDWVMWPLSCYAHSKEVPCLPGFVDISPEELRFAAYTANSLGNSAAFLQGIEELLMKQRNMKQLYSNITSEEVRRLQTSQPALLSKSTGTIFGPVGTTDSDSIISSLFKTSSSSPVQGTTDSDSSLFKTSSSSPVQPDPKPLQTLFKVGDTNTLFTSAASQKDWHGSTSAVQPPGLSSVMPSQSQRATDNIRPLQDDTSKLTTEDLEAFKGDKFTLGKVPETPPPIQLC